MLSLDPSLKAGALVDDRGVEQHFFAHDGTHAYDSAGRHPLPYTGVHADSGLQPLYGVDLDDYDEDGDEQDVEHAKRHAVEHGILKGRYQRTAATGGDTTTWHPKAVKDLKALDRPVQKQILSTIDGIISGDPATTAQSHPLNGVLKGWTATKASRGHRIVHRPNDQGGIHVGYVGLHEYDKAIQRLTSLEEPETRTLDKVTQAFHVAPEHAHDSIQMHGIRPGFDGNIHLSTSIDDARHLTHGFGPHVWMVRVPAGTRYHQGVNGPGHLVLHGDSLTSNLKAVQVPDWVQGPPSRTAARLSLLTHF